DVVAARAAGVPVVHRRVALSALCAQRTVAAVAGRHGQTTTFAPHATDLHGARRHPGWIPRAHVAAPGCRGGRCRTGPPVAGLDCSAEWGGDGPLVVEADESDGTFLAVRAHGAVVTNVEPDHLEHWGDEAHLRAGFEQFVAALPGPAVLCLDDPGSAALAGAAKEPTTYGTDPAADYRVADVQVEGTGVRFSLVHDGEHHVVVLPAAPGVHNARNAAGALALAHRLGVPLADGVAALAGFRGVARRFELRGEAGGVVFVDSYDHLPSEIAAALAAARAGGWRRVVAVFQPHRYSRTAALGA